MENLNILNSEINDLNSINIQLENFYENRENIEPEYGKTKMAAINILAQATFATNEQDLPSAEVGESILNQLSTLRDSLESCEVSIAKVKEYLHALPESHPLRASVEKELGELGNRISQKYNAVDHTIDSHEQVHYSALVAETKKTMDTPPLKPFDILDNLERLEKALETIPKKNTPKWKELKRQLTELSEAYNLQKRLVIGTLVLSRQFLTEQIDDKGIHPITGGGEPQRDINTLMTRLNYFQGLKEQAMASPRQSNTIDDLCEQKLAMLYSMLIPIYNEYKKTKDPNLLTTIPIENLIAFRNEFSKRGFPIAHTSSIEVLPEMELFIQFVQGNVSSQSTPNSFHAVLCEITNPQGTTEYGLLFMKDIGKGLLHLMEGVSKTANKPYVAVKLTADEFAGLTRIDAALQGYFPSRLFADALNEWKQLFRAIDYFQIDITEEFNKFLASFVFWGTKESKEKVTMDVFRIYDNTDLSPVLLPIMMQLYKLGKLTVLSPSLMQYCKPGEKVLDEFGWGVVIKAQALIGDRYHVFDNKKASREQAEKNVQFREDVYHYAREQDRLGNLLDLLADKLNDPNRLGDADLLINLELIRNTNYSSAKDQKVRTAIELARLLLASKVIWAAEMGNQTRVSQYVRHSMSQLSSHRSEFYLPMIANLAKNVSPAVCDLLSNHLQHLQVIASASPAIMERLSFLIKRTASDILTYENLDTFEEKELFDQLFPLLIQDRHLIAYIHLAHNTRSIHINDEYAAQLKNFDVEIGYYLTENEGSRFVEELKSMLRSFPHLPKQITLIGVPQPYLEQLDVELKEEFPTIKLTHWKSLLEQQKAIKDSEAS